MYRRLTFVLGVCLVAACGGDGPNYDVPNSNWSVRLVAAQHTGQPLMRIRVNDAFEWPTIDANDSSEPIAYQVRLHDDTGATVDGVGWVDEQSRRGVAVIVSDWVVGELTIDPVADEARIKPRATALAEVLRDTSGTTVGDLATLFGEADKVTLDRTLSARLDERARVESYSLELVPYFDGAQLSHNSDNRNSPLGIQLEWGTPLTSFPGCADGSTAEDCVRSRVEAFGTILCDARTETNMARFPELCTQIEQRLARKVQDPAILCALPDDTSVSASDYDPTSDVGSINGGHILAGFDGDSAIMHQLSHAQAWTDNRLSNLALVRGAEGDFARALAAGHAAVDANDYDEARLQADKLLSAALTLSQSEEIGAGERIDSECQALFTTIESADLFGYPDFGNAWLFGTIINGVAELAGLRRDYYLPAESFAVTGALCSCMNLAADWLDQRSDVQTGLSQTFVSTDPPVTATDLIDGLAASYCGL